MKLSYGKSLPSMTTRVRDLVSRDPEFDRPYFFQPVLDACCCVIPQPFRLNSMFARTLRRHMPGKGFSNGIARRAVSPQKRFRINLWQAMPRNIPD